MEEENEGSQKGQVWAKRKTKTHQNGGNDKQRRRTKHERTKTTKTTKRTRTTKHGHRSGHEEEGFQCKVSQLFRKRHFICTGLIKYNRFRTLKSEHGNYPVWMSNRKIQQMKSKSKKKAAGKIKKKKK